MFLRLGFNCRLTEGGGAGPSAAPPGVPCCLGFSVRLTEGGGEKGVMGRSAGLGLANGKGLARFEYTLGDMADAADDPVTVLLLNVKISAAADAPVDGASPGAAFE